MLADIKRRVEEKVKENNKQIIIGMYQKKLVGFVKFPEYVGPGSIRESGTLRYVKVVTR